MKQQFQWILLSHDRVHYVSPLLNVPFPTHPQFCLAKPPCRLFHRRPTSSCRLLVLNFYPYLQKYIAPHQRDVTVVLAALVMACHELVPPENLAPVLKQLVDQFVHDK